MLTDSTRKYLSRIVGLYDTKKTIMSFATVLCLIPKKFTGACKKREMDWQLVASYFTVKSTDIFYSVPHNHKKSNLYGTVMFPRL